MNRGIKALIASLIIIIVAVGAFLGGVVFADRLGVVPSADSIIGEAPSDLESIVDQVEGIIKNEALEPSSDDSITANAVQGMLDSLGDPYATYFDPKEYTDLQQDQMGEFFGIGVTLGLNKDGQPTATRIFEDTPAAKAGIKVGDVFTAVDGIRKDKWDLDEFVKKVRGPLGTKVKLEVTRKAKKPFVVVMVRDRIAVPNVMKKTYGKVGYIRLMTFNERSASDVEAAIKQFDSKGVEGYVLDLRGNPGGLLDSAIDVSSIFVEDGIIVRIDERGKPESAEEARGGAVTTKPLVVLVDNGSASASEIVSGALKDHKRATIVGETTFGKGSVQTVRRIANGGAVKLTIAHYLTPLKKVINKVGVKPDVVVVMDPHLQADAKKDTQLKRALEVLRSKL